MPTVFLSEKAQKQFNELEKTLQERMRKTLKRLERNPSAGKPLHPSRFWSIRCGDYRAIYEFIPPSQDLLVFLIDHRSRVYETLGRNL